MTGIKEADLPSLEIPRASPDETLEMSSSAERYLAMRAQGSTPGETALSKTVEAPKPQASYEGFRSKNHGSHVNDNQQSPGAAEFWD